MRGLTQTKAATYGAGLAPFFLGLATWIGAFVLFLLLRPLSRRALAAGSPRCGSRSAAGCLPRCSVSRRSLVMFSTVTLRGGHRAVEPLGTFGFLRADVADVRGDPARPERAFGAVGKFVGLVLLILQLVSAGGTFPWQTIPVPLYPLHYGLPMGYAVDGLRHLMYGGDLGSVGQGRPDPGSR